MNCTQLENFTAKLVKKKHERQLVEKLKKSFENDLDIYNFKKN